MAITVDPKSTPSAPVTEITGTDGVLSAKVDTDNAGVMLRADVSAWSPVPLTVRFFRGDGTLVRGGDPAYAPGGVAHAYDHEAPIGAASYYVQACDADLAAVGDPSARIAMQVPNPSGTRNLWLKNPTQPALSMPLWVESPPQVTRAARNTVTAVPGSRMGLASWDVRTGYETTLQVVTRTAAEAGSLEALLDSGILFVQTRADYDFPEFYCLPGDWTRDRVSYISDPTSRWSVPLNECRRPATIDAPLRIPGLSWETVAAQYLTWENLAAQVSSWDDLLWGWL